RTVYIEKEDFSEVRPDNKYKRLSLGREVRLFHSYFIKAVDVVKNDQGEVTEVLATYDELTKSGSGFNERKPDGTIHYVEATTAIKSEFDFYTELLDADTTKSLDERVLQNSLTRKNGYIESALK